MSDAQAREVVLLDPWPSTPDYNCGLCQGLREQGVAAQLWTADYHHRPPESADVVPGRVYFFLRLSRLLRRRFKQSRWLTYASFATMGPEYLADWARLLWYVVRRRPLVHVQWSLHPLLDVPGLCALRLLGVPIVWTAHNVLPHDGETRANKLLYRLLYGLANLVIVHSRSNLEEMQTLFALGDKVRHVNFGLPFLDLPPVTREAARDVLGWGADEQVFVFQGRVLNYKGLDILLESLTRLRGPRIRLVLSVDWRWAGPEYEEAIARACAHHAVDVFSETTAPARFRDLACGADAWVLPYRTASASFTGMAALRYCTPMIVTDAGSLPEMLGPELTAWVVPPGDVDALAAALERFVALSAEARLDIAAVMERHRVEFMWPQIAARTIGLYRTLSAVKPAAELQPQ